MQKHSLETALKAGVIIISAGLLTILHYQTKPAAGIVHVIFRELYFLPIILGGFWFGLRGGLITAFSISLFYGPRVLPVHGGISPHDFGNILEILLFNLVGGLLGWLKDRETAQDARARKAESLAAVGEAAAMIAHDLKTPLITIVGLARRLTGKIPPDTPEGEKVKVIRQQAERLETLVAEILFFAKPQKLSLQQNDLYQLLQEAKDTVREVADTNGITVSTPAGNKCLCPLDHDKMVRVFVNLMTNAIEVSPKDQAVTVSLHRLNDRLVIDVADRGPGIPAEITEKIFEPFVTGKNKGTGLGLPISRKIVEAHAGKLECLNNADKGVTFRITLPVGI